MASARAIAVLGASSRIARDFIAGFSQPEILQFFGRSGAMQPYATFPGGTYAAMINFVGVGDPVRTRKMGADILSVTRQYDELALEYQQRHPDTRYIFLSSGAAYGVDFLAPARDGDERPIMPDGPQHYYGAAKQEAEARHRGLPNLPIFDLRVFSYVSRTMDLSAQFLLAEMVRCIRDRRVFRTASTPMVRDYLHPSDFQKMMQCCLAAQGNTALDCYSLAPISKPELLDLMAARFSMEYEIHSAPATPNVTGEKPFYYSESRRAAALGYRPDYSSQSAIISEVGAILSGN